MRRKIQELKKCLDAVKAYTTADTEIRMLREVNRSPSP